MKKRQNFNVQEPQRNRNGTAFFVNLIMSSTVHVLFTVTMYNELQKNVLMLICDKHQRPLSCVAFDQGLRYKKKCVPQ